MKSIVWILIMALTVFSCRPSIEGNGIVKRETREISTFKELEISNAFKVYLKQGDTSSLVVEADENLLEHIQSDANGDELKIHADANFSRYNKLNLYITVQDIRDIEISGACSVKGEGVIRSSSLDINASGASEIDLEIEAGKLELDMSGASDIRLQGRAENFYLDASGASELEAFDFRAIDADVEVSGASQLDIYVTGKLEIKASGASEIRYKGTPKNLRQKAGGAAEIKSYSN